jgi:hypothetical protein
MWQSRKNRNSTNYYYNHSGAREQEEFLLEYKFLLPSVSAKEIAKTLTMRRGFPCTVLPGKTAAKCKN